jgi:arabinofuranan 3-O-arabinosyltransferase
VVTDLDLSTQPGGSPGGSAGSAGASAPAGPAAASSPPRTAALLTWQADRRSLRIGPGAESYLEIHENFNAGWTATLNGRALTPVRLDGWQQAFIVPAGEGGVIRLSYGPAIVYHAGLIASALALLVLVLLATGLGGLLWRSRGLWRFRGRTAAGTGPAAGPPPDRPPYEPPYEPPSWPPLRPPSWPPDGPPGRLDERRNEPPSRPPHGPPDGPGGGGNEPSAWRRAARTAAAFVLLAVVIGLAGGPAAAAVPVLACLGWWRPRWLPLVALGAMLIAGVVAASSGSFTQLGSGAFGGLAQACALVALTAALMPEIVRTTAGKAGRTIAEQAGREERAT